MVEHLPGCLICGAALAYLDDRRILGCAVCGKAVRADACCEAGHFVCDKCHALGALDLVERVCLRSTEADPLRLARGLMTSPAVHLHGPEHHFLVPAVLITAVCKSRADLVAVRKRMLAQARERVEDIRGGVCGYWGTCGAAIGVGIFASVLMGITPLSRGEWRLANSMTARCLDVIAHHGGPRCCKRNTFLAIIEAAAFLRDEVGADVPIARDLRCAFHDVNRECLKGGCPFYPDG